MASDREARRDQGLTLQDALTAEISATAESLSAEDWSRATNCPPWAVRDIVAHLTRGAETFAAMVDTGLRGERTFAVSVEAREQRQRELTSLSPTDLVATLKSAQSHLRSTLSNLTTDQLEVLCPHTRGLQPGWWFVDQRLSELAFHGWDLHHSIGREREIAPSVGQYLLPTLLERNLRTWHKPSPASYGQWVVQANDLENGAWLIEPDDGGVGINRRAAKGDITIEGDAAALIRWLYGRANLDELEQAQRVSIRGARLRLAAWKGMFPSP
ncbi:MAG: maleylpyruvate isomerase family mycothiol-dependent enzyme [Chloroflexota bacterium]